jgi:hypothetical protein
MESNVHARRLIVTERRRRERSRATGDWRATPAEAENRELMAQSAARSAAIERRSEDFENERSRKPWPTVGGEDE